MICGGVVFGRALLVNRTLVVEKRRRRSPKRMYNYFYIPSWATGCSDIRSNIILDVFEKVLLGKRVSPLQCGGSCPVS